LSEAQVGAYLKVLEDRTLFASGQRTAGPTARALKSNLQGERGKPEIDRIVSTVRERLLAHTEFCRFAQPAKIGRVLVSRYEPGMTYGAHFDDALIDGLRTDLSFTVFLSEPDSYEGGELEMMTTMGTQAIKLPPGCAIVYPSDLMHAVKPVGSGVRLAVGGWVQSKVRLLEQRAILYELASATAALADASAPTDALTRLKYVQNNLLRQWTQ